MNFDEVTTLLSIGALACVILGWLLRKMYADYFGK